MDACNDCMSRERHGVEDSCPGSLNVGSPRHSCVNVDNKLQSRTSFKRSGSFNQKDESHVFELSSTQGQRLDFTFSGRCLTSEFLYVEEAAQWAGFLML
ncbi:hypothetical protein LINPERPRIM_LOCUS23301 [Linum perenne]